MRILPQVKVREKVRKVRSYSRRCRWLLLGRGGHTHPNVDVPEVDRLLGVLTTGGEKKGENELTNQPAAHELSLPGVLCVSPVVQCFWLKQETTKLKVTLHNIVLFQFCQAIPLQFPGKSPS